MLGCKWGRLKLATVKWRWILKKKIESKKKLRACFNFLMRMHNQRKKDFCSIFLCWTQMISWSTCCVLILFLQQKKKERLMQFLVTFASWRDSLFFVFFFYWAIFYLETINCYPPRRIVVCHLNKLNYFLLHLSQYLFYSIACPFNYLIETSKQRRVVSEKEDLINPKKNNGGRKTVSKKN